MKILLVNLSTKRLYDVSEGRPIFEPFWAESLVPMIKEEHKVRIFDMNLKTNLESTLLKFRPDYVGISVVTPLVKEAKQVIRLARGVLPHTKIIVGGPHISAMRTTLGADVGVVGEGDGVIRELLKGYKSTTKKLLFQPKPIQNLDKIPFPYRLPRKDYYLNYDFGNGKQVLASILTSRSCPFKCTYCASKCIFGNNVRFRSANNVIKELEQLKSEYDVNSLYVLDDSFTLIPRRVEKICKSMIKKKLDMKWWVNTRCDIINKETLELMKKAGCKFIVYGVESGSPRILKKIKKNVSIEQIKKAFKITHEVGIDTKANFMLGHLDETLKDMQMSIKLAEQLNAVQTRFYKVIPLPGSPLYDVAIRRGLIKSKNFDNYAWYKNPPNISKVPTRTLNGLHKEAWLTFSPIVVNFSTGRKYHIDGTNPNSNYKEGKNETRDRG